MSMSSEDQTSVAESSDDNLLKPLPIVNRQTCPRCRRRVSIIDENHIQATGHIYHPGCYAVVGHLANATQNEDVEPDTFIGNDIFKDLIMRYSKI